MEQPSDESLSKFEPGLPYKLAGQLLLNRRYWCQWCPAEIMGFRDRRSAAEFRASGMCQACQDKAFTEPEKKTKPRGTRYNLI